MKFKFPTLAAAAALFSGFTVFSGVPGPAAAGEITELRTIGHWKIRAIENLCDASGTFRDGTSLEFSINAKGALMITVINPKWSINKGDDYDVGMQVDRAQVQTSKAKAHDTWVTWQIPATEASLNLLSYGRTLKAQIGRAEVSYDLALSEPVLKALGTCVATRLTDANPFSGAAPQASTPPASNPYVETPSNPYRRM